MAYKSCISQKRGRHTKYLKKKKNTSGGKPLYAHLNFDVAIHQKERRKNLLSHTSNNDVHLVNDSRKAQKVQYCSLCRAQKTSQNGLLQSRFNNYSEQKNSQQILQQL